MTGVVVGLRRYPVKSMLGEELHASHLTGLGLLGDRAHGLIDQVTGTVVSVKMPRKWARMLECSASYLEPPRPGAELPPVRIALPGGGTVLAADPDVDRRLSDVLGRPVRLAVTPPADARLEKYWPSGLEGLAPAAFIEPDLAPSDQPGETMTRQQMAMASPGTFFDFSPIHLLSTATVERLGRLNPRSRFDIRRFRPNIVVRPDPPASAGEADGAFAESGWVGRQIAIGDRVRLQVLLPTPRCAVPAQAQAQGDLVADIGVLRTIIEHNSVDLAALGGRFACAGAYAAVLEGGLVRRGDRVTVR